MYGNVFVRVISDVCRTDLVVVEGITVLLDGVDSVVRGGTVRYEGLRGRAGDGGSRDAVVCGRRCGRRGLDAGRVGARAGARVAWSRARGLGDAVVTVATATTFVDSGTYGAAYYCSYNNDRSNSGDDKESASLHAAHASRLG